MAENESTTTRRSVMQAAGLGLGAMLAATSGAVAAATSTEVSAADYWANKGEVKLFLYRKRVAPQAAAPPQPVLFLVHG